MTMPKRSAVVVAVFLALAACASNAPPTLSPTGVTAFQATRVVKALDVLRDAAIDANAQVPPLLSTPNTRKVVSFHESAVKTIGVAPSGWQLSVSEGLNQLQSNMPPAEWQRIAPYVTLAKTLIIEVSK